MTKHAFWTASFQCLAKNIKLVFIEKISGINPVSTSAVSLSVIVKFKILH